MTATKPLFLIPDKLSRYLPLADHRTMAGPTTLVPQITQREPRTLTPRGNLSAYKKRWSTCSKTRRPTDPTFLRDPLLGRAVSTYQRSPALTCSPAQAISDGQAWAARRSPSSPGACHVQCINPRYRRAGTPRDSHYKSRLLLHPTMAYSPSQTW
jgi:hypothetical protein